VLLSNQNNCPIKTTVANNIGIITLQKRLRPSLAETGKLGMLPVVSLSVAELLVGEKITSGHQKTSAQENKRMITGYLG
jgi:hypothetical protein